MEYMAKEWKMVGNGELLSDPKAHRLNDEALAAAPKGYLGENVIAMLPKKTVIGKCRICGKHKQLTKEHIPLKNSGNKQNTASHSLDDWLKNQDVRDLGKGKVAQGGIYGFTLCSDCNSLTGTRFGGEYTKWAANGFAVLSELPLDELNSQQGPFAQGIQFGTKDKPVFPGSMARQVLSFMCSLSGSWDIAERYPIIRALLLSDVVASLPDDLDLGMALYAGPRGRTVGPQLKVDVENMSWQWVMEVAFPPFAFTMVLLSNKTKPLHGLVLNEWFAQKAKDSVAFKGEVEIGFGWSPFPGDYRTLAAINKQANTK
jgi:hypothetical protein